MTRPFQFNFEEHTDVLKFKSIVESMIGEIASHNMDLAEKYIKKLRMVDPADDSDCGSPFYDYIVQKKSGLYMILSGDRCSLPCFSIREFQNMYYKYREYESFKRLNTDIDIKLLEIFNLF